MNKRNFAQRKFRSRRYRGGPLLVIWPPGDRRNMVTIIKSRHTVCRAAREPRADAIRADDQRSLLKLPPRGPDGWTAEEILAWEKYRLETMFKPVIMAMPTDGSWFKEECEKTPGSIVWVSPQPREEKL
jgi:hypothetical protein